MALPRLSLGTPTARRPYLFFTKGAAAPNPRGSALVPPKVGMARSPRRRLRAGGRRRPIFAAKPPLHPRNGAPAPESWDPGGAASLPFLATQKALQSAIKERSEEKVSTPDATQKAMQSAIRDRKEAEESDAIKKESAKSPPE